MYCKPGGLLGSPSWCNTICLFPKGLGPYGFAIERKPLPLATKIFFPTTATLVGYQPTGIKPLLLLSPFLRTSKTARQLLSALAMYKVFSSLLKAIPLVVDPLGASANSAAFRVSTTFLSATCITETELSFELATIR